MVHRGHTLRPYRPQRQLDRPGRPDKASGQLLFREEDTMLRMVTAALAALLAPPGPAGAQDYPTRPVTMVIPFAAGGPQDTIGRVFAQRMGEVLGQQVVVENVGGAGGMTGSKRVADSPPDGYTMILASVGTHAQNQSLYKKPLYNAATDFAAVAFLAETPIAIIPRKALPAGHFPELTPL